MKTLILSLVLGLSATAEPAWLDAINIPKKAPLRQISPTKLEYVISFNGKGKAGTFSILFGEKAPRYPKHFLVRAHGGSTGWAQTLFPYQFHYLSFLNPKTLRPTKFVGTEREGSKVTALHYRFDSKGVSGTKKKTENDETQTEASNFSYPYSLGLFSGLLQIRSLPLKDNDELVMALHPVTTPYLTKITVLGREVHLGRKCIKLSIGAEKIEVDMSLKHEDDPKTASIWLSDDDWRIPIEMRGEMPIGPVRVFLTKHENL
ncbi:MAG: DUF3108 domain-containing protein [Akkermansiaceae bacterium]|jgi:hypothetical protein|nr:DUF3108 domain-containing protein [Akkermansiaceae bacterium]